MNGELSQPLRFATDSQQELPQWAKEIQPHMEALAVAQQEIGVLTNSFYPRGEDCPAPPRALLNAKILVVREAINIAGRALDNLTMWANAED